MQLVDNNESNPCIVIDNGSGYIKAGFSDEEGPSSIFQTIAGYPKYPLVMIGNDNKDYYVGIDILIKRGLLELNYPIEHGAIKNKDEMEKIWNYIFTYELRVAPEEHNVMITEFSEYSKENREFIVEEMFETFNVPGLYIINPAMLPLYSHGKYTGFVLDLGDGITQFVPIFDGYRLPYNDYFNFGGRDLTNYFRKLLNENEYKFNKSNEFELVNHIKEKACYVALDYEEELKSYYPFDYELPDGNDLILSDQRIRVP